MSGVIARDGLGQSVSAASAVLKPGAYGAPFRGFGGLTAALHREPDIHAVKA